MTYLPHHFAKAFVDLAYNEPEAKQVEMAQGLVAAVTKHRLQNKLPVILAEIERLITKKAGGRVISLELARSNTKLAEVFKKICRPEDSFQVTEKTDLIAGARLIIDNEKILDCSFSRRLATMFSGLA